MVGHRVLIVTNDGFPSSGHYDGVLHRLDASGAVIWPYHQMPEQAANVFIPMRRIKEIRDQGRAP